MKSVCTRSSMKVRATAIARLFAASLSILVIFCLASTAAFAQCTLSSPDTWSHGANGNWNNGANWSGGVPNSATTIPASPMAPAPLHWISRQCRRPPACQRKHAELRSGNTSLSVNGTQIINAGVINVNGGGGTNTYLYLPTSVDAVGRRHNQPATTTTGGGGNAYHRSWNPVARPWTTWITRFRAKALSTTTVRRLTTSWRRHQRQLNRLSTDQCSRSRVRRLQQRRLDGSDRQRRLATVQHHA